MSVMFLKCQNNPGFLSKHIPVWGRGSVFRGLKILEPICTRVIGKKELTCLVSTSGGGNGNPLQCSCLENAMDGGAWWATVHGVTRVRDN